MSARRDLQRRLASLQEIRGIMNSMKALAMMESRKLDRLQQSQRLMVATIERAARDLLRHSPGLRPAGKPARTVTLLIGSERGFCGDFNESLLAGKQPAGPAPGKDRVLVGHKLRIRAGDDPRVVAALDGADVAEDVDAVLARLVTVINQVQAEQAAREPNGNGHAGVAVLVRFHGEAVGEPAERMLSPPWIEAPAEGAGSGLPPLLNLDARTMLRRLVEHYLYAALHEVLLASLWAENLRRARHLDGAVNRLDERIERLNNRSQQLRQEEIVEEIEVILLNAATEGN